MLVTPFLWAECRIAFLKNPNSGWLPIQHHYILFYFFQHQQTKGGVETALYCGNCSARELECEKGGGKARREGGFNRKKLESSDHQLVRECVINTVMRSQVCGGLQPQRKCAKSKWELPFFPLSLGALLSSRHLYLGLNLLRLGQCSHYISGQGLEPTWRWPLPVLPQG